MHYHGLFFIQSARFLIFWNCCQVELDGIIGGGGYLCGCSMCSYSRVRYTDLFIAIIGLFALYLPDTYCQCFLRCSVPMSLSSMLVLRLDIQIIIYS
jgi:hypothetical protein